jgi:protein-tyrosine phosphatase
VIDLHCHILPGLDDGAPDVDDSLAMARALLGVGFTTVAASPHIGPGPGGDVPLAAADEARAALTVALREAQLPLSLLPNGEHQLSIELFERLGASGAVAIGGRGRWLLTELPWGGLANLESVLFRLQTKGWRVLLAHPERFDFVSADALERLCERGVRLQLDLGSFVGMFGDIVRERAMELTERGVAHVLATDMHRSDQAEAWLASALKLVAKRFGREALSIGTEGNPQRIIDDAAPELVPPLLETS